MPCPAPCPDPAPPDPFPGAGPDLFPGAGPDLFPGAGPDLFPGAPPDLFPGAGPDRVLASLAACVAAVRSLPCPTGLGAAPVLREQTREVARAVVVLQRELAVRMAALERQEGPPADVRGEASRAGMPGAQSARLRRLGVFAAAHPGLQEAWLGGAVPEEHVAALARGAAKLPTAALRGQLVAQVLPLLAGLDPRGARQAVAHAVDILAPRDPDLDELTDHAARRLAWSAVPGGGIVFEGYLPLAEADAFTRAIDALAHQLRAQGDGLSPAQRKADGLAALIARAAAHGLPPGGGLPAALTLTVSLAEAERIAGRDPATIGLDHQPRPHGGAQAGGRPCGDATLRFGLCCAAVTPILHRQPHPHHSPLQRIAATNTEPLAVGRAVRLATAAQRKALQLRDRGCVVPGCDIAAPYTQPHHVTAWSMDGPTDLTNLVSLCFVHHRQTELGRYTFLPKTPGQPKPPDAHDHPNWWIIPPQPEPTDTRNSGKPIANGGEGRAGRA